MGDPAGTLKGVSDHQLASRCCSDLSKRVGIVVATEDGSLTGWMSLVRLCSCDNPALATLLIIIIINY